MNSEEQQRLMRLVERIAAQPGMPKDPDTVSALAQLLRQRPDAAYWLLQHCLRLEVALGRAQPAPAGVTAPPAPEPAALRDLLGEFTNTSLLGDLAELGHPGPAGTAAKPPPASAPPHLRDLLGEFTNTSLLGDLTEPEEPKPRRDASGAAQRR